MKDTRVPGDKSLTHRALLLSALAHGRSRVRDALLSADTEATASVLRSLGCAVPPLGPDIVIDGVGLHGLRAAERPLDCGNSGTTARLLLGVLAGFDFMSTLTGDASLRARPMRRVTQPLERMGARFEELDAPDRLPVRVHGGRLVPIDWHSEKASAQVKSALLLAGLTGRTAVTVREPYLSRDHSERMLAGMGVALRRHSAGDEHRVELEPADTLAPVDFTVPGDFSSAAFLLAFGCLGGGPVRVRDVGLNPTRTGLLAVLRRMGADVRTTNERESGGEPAGDVIVAPSALRGTRVAADEVPSLIDEIPVIAMLAARADGSTVIEGAAELRVKETDRIAALVHNLRALGVDAQERPDGLAVQGTDRPLDGRIEAFGDHRIAMAFGVLAACGRNRIHVDDPDVVGVSFPGFWSTLQRLGAA